MATEDKKESDSPKVAGFPVSKRHQLLQDIQKQLNGFNVDAIVETAGHKFHMVTMDSDEEMLVDGFMQTDSPAQAVSSFRKSRIAGAIRDIDSVPVAELFLFPETMSEPEKKYYSETKYGKRTWEINQLYQWLGDLPSSVIDELANEYQTLSKKRRESLDELKKSSAKTPHSGESKDSSSPVRESSPVTQM